MVHRFLLVLMGILFFSTSVQAALVSDTVGKWQVNFIERKGNVEPYCAAANLYTNKTILIMAFGTDGSGSIAFNFQQPSFEKGKVYPVHLSFPDGVTGRFDAKADSDQAVIIKTGKESPLWQNIYNNVQMTLVVPPLERVFSLTSFPTVYQGVRTCLQDNTGTTLPLVQKQQPKPSSSIASISAPVMPSVTPTSTMAVDTVSPASTSAVPAMPQGMSDVQMPEPMMMQPTTPVAPVSGVMVENTSSALSKPLLHLLNKSGVILAKEGQRVFEDTGYIRQEWNTAQGYQGKFEQVYWDQGKRFHDLAQAYLNKRGLDCKGDYMPMGEEPYRVEDTAISVGKFFCMESTGMNKAAAVMFFAVGNTFSAIEHEAHFDALEKLINIRENMVSVLENMSSPKYSQSVTGMNTQPNAVTNSMGEEGRTVKFVAPSLPLNLYSN